MAAAAMADAPQTAPAPPAPTTTTTAAHRHAGAPWVERYRPRRVEDVASQDEVVATLRKALDTGSLPHMLFYGPPGTGKTSAALAVARQLYGPELCRTRVLELNASDERGIGVVRGKIKAFASAAVGAPAAGYPSPPFKLLILDEADSMTQDAQNALRRTMEAHSRVTRFVFICNYVSRIIDPLASRCAKFRFKPLHPEAMAGRISHICAKEGVTMAPGALDMLGRVSGGDLRKAVTTLQSAARLAAGGEVDAQAVSDVSGVAPSALVSGLLAACREPSFEAVERAAKGAVAEGWPTQQLLLQLQEAILAAPADGEEEEQEEAEGMEVEGEAAAGGGAGKKQRGEGWVPASRRRITDAQRGHAAVALAVADKALVDGADEYLQLLNVLARVQQALNNRIK
jgi:replication factor C subunit 2/4